MDRLSVAASAIRVYLVRMADHLFGCSHGRTGFPITIKTSVTADDGQQTTLADTYVVCLDCGRTFDYDLTTMRPTKQRPPVVGGG